LQVIDDLERLIVQGFDERHAVIGTDSREVRALRPGVVALAKAVAARLRAEYSARPEGR
jgi:hypothetical protein